MICSSVTEKLDRQLFTTSILFPFFQTFPGRLERMTSRWPDRSDFHSQISALVPRPKFMTPSWRKGKRVGSTTSRCSGKEPALLPRTDGWKHEFAIINYHQSDRCLLKSSRQQKIIVLEQISNGGCKGVV